MRRLYFIVNPVSGSGMGKTRFERIMQILDAKGADYGYVFTQYPRHAISLAEEAVAAGERCIVSVGGDGTLREVAGVIAAETGVTLGILPFGTGNDYANGVGLPCGDDEALVSILLDGTARPVDAGEANGQFFMNVAGFGFDVDVVRYTEKFKKKLNGMLPYMLGILKSLVYLSRTKVEVETDDGGRFCVEATLFSVCNGTRFAGGIKLAPLSDPADGLFDVCVLKGVSRLRFLYLFPGYIKGKHLKHKDDFLYFKAKTVSANCGEKLPLELDGELIGETPVRFAVKPAALTLLAGD